jgi:hypothetical protein
VAFDGVQLGKTHVLDLLDNVFPVHVIHSFPARDTTQQISLVFRPGKDVAVIQSV